jgi:hypothetical protein
MDLKKQIGDLIKQLENTSNIEEKEDIEDQILRLADILEDKQYEDERIVLDDNANKNQKNIKKEDEVIEEELEELDEKEIKKQQRLQERVTREQKYLDDNKLSSHDEEMRRQDMMNEALDENDDYASRKNRVINKNRRK